MANNGDPAGRAWSGQRWLPAWSPCCSGADLGAFAM